MSKPSCRVFSFFAWLLVIGLTLYGLALAARWLLQQLFWTVGRRLFLSYLLVGVMPFVLMFILLLTVIYMFAAVMTQASLRGERQATLGQMETWALEHALTGRRISGTEAVRIGLADVLVPQSEVRSAAQALALEIAQSSPLAVLSTRETVRRGLCDEIEAATERELVEQDWLRRTEDFSEGIKAYGERRLPNFQGR